MTNRGELKEIETNYDVITRSVRESDGMKNLSMTQKKMLVRWNFADNLIQAHPYWFDKDIIKNVQDKFGVSYITAFYDLHNAKLLFGSRHIEHKPFWRQFIISEAKEGMKLAMMKSKPDLKAHYEYLKLIAGIVGAYGDDVNQLTAEMMRPADNYIIINSNDKHLHLHLDKLEEMDPDLMETLHKSAVAELKMPEIEIEDGEATETDQD